MQTLFLVIAILVLLLLAAVIVHAAWHDKRIKEDIIACGLVAISDMYEPPIHLLSLSVSFKYKAKAEVVSLRLCAIRGIWEEFDDDYREELLEAWYFERYGMETTPCIHSQLES